MIEAAITGDEHRHLAAGRAGGYRVVATIILAHALVGGVAVIFGYGGIAVHAERAFQHATQRAVAVAPVHRLHQHRYRGRSEEHTSELQSLMRISYAVFCLKKKNNNHTVI